MCRAALLSQLYAMSELAGGAGVRAGARLHLLVPPRVVTWQSFASPCCAPLSLSALTVLSLSGPLPTHPPPPLGGSFPMSFGLNISTRSA